MLIFKRRALVAAELHPLKCQSYWVLMAKAEHGQSFIFSRFVDSRAISHLAACGSDGVKLHAQDKPTGT